MRLSGVTNEINNLDAIKKSLWTQDLNRATFLYSGIQAGIVTQFLGWENNP